MSSGSQQPLLKSRRFLPFFITQALGAFNDNVYKNALLLLITFGGAAAMGVDNNLVINLAAGLFILPFFLFSPLAGQIADKYEKSSIIRKVKFAEVIVMGLGAVSLVYEAYWAMLVLLFVMGAQSAFFGPVKYALLPQQLEPSELVSGNALVEMGTFLAILFGTILAGFLVDMEHALYLVSGSVLLLALMGYWSSRHIPELPASNPDLKINWNPISELCIVLKETKQNRAVFLSILAISWFWFLGASYLTQFPNFTKEVLNGNAQVVTLLLTVFSIGVATGSLLCEKLSGKMVELGIVPIGALGLSIFGIDLYFAATNVPEVTKELIGASVFIQSEGNLRVLTDLLLIGVFGGLFIVPLYSVIQQRADEKQTAQVIAANNVLNALFMVASALFGIILLTVLEMSIPEYLLVISIVNIVVCVYVFHQVPEFALRFIVFVLSHTIYRVKHEGLDRIPREGPAVIVCNHVSYVDAFILAGACRRPIRFVMDKPIYDLPIMNWLFKLARTIPITSKKKDPEAYSNAFDRISNELKEGNVVLIFPEGRLTRDGEIDQFKRGVETIIERDPVPVIPMGLKGLWGSFFSHKGGPAFTTGPRRFWSRVKIVAGDVYQPSEISAPMLEAKVRGLVGSEA